MGFDAFRFQLEQYPGGLPAERFDDPNRGCWATRSAGRFRRATRSCRSTGPERFTTVTRAPYPDGSCWWVVSILTMKDDKIWHAETYFAPEFEPPEWRKGIVEIVPRD